ncbi:MAG: SGNH/GDSL hydrolase family protein [Polyangiaceae bacterium]|nr:SGNH/GDSL hydrolase family protein [Polyangiaceae bacterium]
MITSLHRIAQLGVGALFATSLLGCDGGEAASSSDEFNLTDLGLSEAESTVSSFDVTTGAAIQGSLTCAPQPTQAFVFGDSIAACYGVSEEVCAVGAIADRLDGVPTTNLAEGGSVTADIAAQIQSAEPEDGHALVVIQVIGNDLTPFIIYSDEQSLEEIGGLQAEVLQIWNEDIFPALEDKFSDGYTLVMNTQYNPFECTLGAVKDQLILETDDLLIGIAEEHASTTVIANAHPAWVGHGNGFENTECATHDPEYEGWMADVIHPNEVGHAYLGLLWVDALDFLSSDCR